MYLKLGQHFDSSQCAIQTDCLKQTSTSTLGESRESYPDRPTCLEQSWFQMRNRSFITKYPLKSRGDFDTSCNIDVHQIMRVLTHLSDMSDAFNERPTEGNTYRDLPNKAISHRLSKRCPCDMNWLLLQFSQKFDTLISLSTGCYRKYNKSDILHFV